MEISITSGPQFFNIFITQNNAGFKREYEKGKETRKTSEDGGCVWEGELNDHPYPGLSAKYMPLRTVQTKKYKLTTSASKYSLRSAEIIFPFLFY